MRMLRRIWELVYVLTGEGPWRLDPHEAAILAAACEGMPGDLARRVAGQLSGGIFVERTNPRINVIRPRRLRAEDLLPLESHGDALMKVGITVEGAREVAQVTFYQGRVFSVETMRETRAYAGRRVVVTGVEAGRPEESFVAEIDGGGER